MKSKNIRLITIAATLFVCIFLFSKFSSAAEWYMQNIYPILATVLSFFSSLFPFSLFDVFTVAILIAFIVLIILTAIRKIKLGKMLYISAYAIIIIISWFYFSWGFSYFRQDYFRRCNIEKINFGEENFKQFAKKFVADANKSYVTINKLNKDSINMCVEESYKDMKSFLCIPYPNGKRVTKKMIFEPIYTKMGISGYFGPFFNETHINTFSTNTNYPFVLAHEKAHQFGIASEAECNLYAFLTCTRSRNLKLRYSAYLSTIGYVLNDYNKSFPDSYKDLYSMVRPEIINDLQYNYNHWTNARNKTLSDIQETAYDTYLKTNKISSGVKNYSEVVELLISSYYMFIR